MAPADGNLRGGAAPPRSRSARAAGLVRLGLGILAATLTGADPLPTQGTAATEATRILQALAGGDAKAFDTASPATLLAAVADPRWPGRERRWTLVLPAALARLTPQQRTSVLARLDQLYRQATASGDASADRLAVDFLPAASALQELRRSRDRAFDRGGFADFLCLHRLITAADPTATDDPRLAIASRLAGESPDADPALALPEPGPAEPVAGPPRTPAIPDGWMTVPGWLLAVDPWQRVLWQHRLERAESVVHGPGAAVVSGPLGWRAFGSDGRELALPTPPAGVRAWAVAAGSAWFGLGSRLYRMDLISGHVSRLRLAEPPLAPPIVRGRHSWWLTATTVVLVADDRISARFDHGLDARAGVTLIQDIAGNVFVANPDGRAWRIQGLASALAGKDAVERGQLLLAAWRPAEALAATGNPPTDADPIRQRALQATAVRARLALNLVAGLDSWPLAGDERALLATSLRRDGSALPQALQAVAGQPGPVSLDPQDALWRHPRTWNHRLQVVPEPRLQPSLPEARPGQPLVDGTSVAASASPQRRDDGTWLIADGVLALQRDATWVSLVANRADGGESWAVRWPATSFLSAPTIGLDVRDGIALVVEGEHLVHVVDLRLGTVLAVRRFQANNALPGAAIWVPGLDGGSVVQSGPLGVGTELVLCGQDGESVIPAAKPIRWIAPLTTQLIVCHGDGTAAIWPGNFAVDLPEVLLRSRVAPLASPSGLTLADRHWAWRR